MVSPALASSATLPKGRTQPITAICKRKGPISLQALSPSVCEKLYEGLSPTVEVERHARGGSKSPIYQGGRFPQRSEQGKGFNEKRLSQQGKGNIHENEEDTYEAVKEGPPEKETFRTKKEALTESGLA